MWGTQGAPRRGLSVAADEAAAAAEMMKTRLADRAFMQPFLVRSHIKQIVDFIGATQSARFIISRYRPDQHHISISNRSVHMQLVRWFE